MAFPDLTSFGGAYPGPYERQMGGVIVALLRLATAQSPDAESNSHVLTLATIPESWSAAHRSFDEVRRRRLQASRMQDQLREAQYRFEEACCQAMYNATEPDDPFDPSAAFYVVPYALDLARAVNVSCTAVVAAIASGWHAA